MKKQIVALTALAGLSFGIAGQASASSIHTVEKGDTLWSISQENNVSVQEIREWNDLDSTTIYPKQQLNIQESSKVYVVESGDTLYGIAQEQGISINHLMSSNQLTSDLIHPGDRLNVSGGSVKAAATSNIESESKPAAASKELTVTATAYTASCDGCSGVTATGIDLVANPNQKVVAVDPSVIPLGSKVWVEGYGEAIAGDVGGAIKGNKVDVFIPSYEDAMNWGRKTVQVKILD